MVLFPIALNTFIHVIMYSYYFASTLGPQWQKALSKWKNKLTIMQMVRLLNFKHIYLYLFFQRFCLQIQFCILLYHAGQVFTIECDVPRLAAMIFLPNVILVFYMFYEFYQENYSKKKKTHWIIRIQSISKNYYCNYINYFINKT